MDLAKKKNELTQLLNQKSAELVEKNRELEIEAALERVRAMAMSMQKPDDLAEVCQTISEQLEALNVKNIRNVQLAIINEEKKNYANYQYFAAYSKQVFEEPLYGTNPAADGMVRAMQKSANSFFVGNIQGEELREFIDWRKKDDQFPDPLLEESGVVYYYFYSIGKGGLGLTTYKEISEESVEVFKRFHKVFTLAYQRYRDIQQALEQAREAQIEAALERVRARAMAMHKADELVEVTLLLRKEMGQLGVEELETSSIYIHNESKGKTECWFSIQDQKDENNLISDHMILDLNDTWVGKQMQKFYRSGNPATSIVMKGENRIEWISYCAEKSDLFSAEGFYGKTIPERTYHLYKFKNGYMGAAAPGDISAESWDLLKRATAVFSLAYTRFSDLKKAEAQAREAQIEAALERVRTASLAMHKTDELKQVIETVFSQLRELNLPLDACYIDIFEEDNYDLHIWVGTGMETYPDQLTLPYLDHPLFKLTKKARLKGESFFTLKDAKKSKDRFVRHLAANYDVAQERIDLMLASEGVDMSVALSEDIALNIYNYHGIIFSEEENQIIRRFSKVFQQAYSRFLDLQKAEAQARESQIPLALERVRARTIAMQSSEELAEVSYLLNKQVVELGIPTRGCAFNIYSEHDSTEWFSSLEGTIPTYKTPRENFFLKYYEAGQRGETLLIEEYGGERIKKHYKYLATLSTTENSEETIEEDVQVVPEFQIDHVAYFKYGYLLFITLVPAPEAHDIFKRFAKEFEQTYTRFLDLQKAEAQAKEARVEASLERLRSRTMGMQHSDELRKVVAVLYEEMGKLDFDIRQFALSLLDKKAGTVEWWGTGFDETILPASYVIHYREKKLKGNPFVKGFIEGVDQQIPFQVQEYKGEKKKQFDDLTFNHTGLKDLPEEVKQQMREVPYLYMSNAFMKYGVLEVIGQTPVDKEKSEILQRFAKVFEQTYTRFLDLKNAEAQARESQIQLGLERVRARAMAMHKSEQLAETAKVLFEQFDLLGKIPDRMSIGIVNEETGNFELWVTDQKGETTDHAFLFRLDETTSVSKIYKAWKKKKASVVVDLSGQELKDWLQFLKNEVKLPINAAKIKDRRVHQAAFFSHGFLLLTSHQPVAEEIMKLLVRFAGVFDLTYTRFLDLQKAEAQARESRIQLALERVRARTMAMHKSDELADAAAVVFDQLTALEIDHFASGLSIIDKETQSAQMWLSYQGNMVPEPLTVNFNATPVLTRVYKAWLKGEPFYSNLTSGEQYNQHIQFLKKIFGEPVEQFLESTKKKLAKSGMEMPGQMVMHHTFFSKGSLILNNITPIKEQEILNRFAKVFEQTYTRFLDLQRAEAQARESEIQLALERVRARTMAMQKSDELAETMHLLSEQLKDLGEEIDQITIGIFDEEKGIIETSASIMGNQIKTMPVPLDEPFVMGKFYQAWKRNETPLIVEIRDEELQKYNKWRNKFLGKRIYPTDQKNGTWVVNAAIFSKGLLSFSDEKQASPESIQLLERFTAVFDLTFTRFLDLKNAEAQARKAKIETALEKVRSRSMGMQKSDELNQVIHVIYDQFDHLGIKVDHTGFIVDYKKREDMLIWLADQNGPLTKIAIPYFDSPHWNSFVEAKKKGKDFFANQLDFETKNRFYKKLFKFIPELPEESKKFYLECPGLAISTVLLDNVGLYIENFSGTPYSDEENKILMRFGKVFQQSYTRFLDLEKAEAQTREAQIEASLEKVRGVALSLQKSDQMLQIAQVLYEQLLELGFNNMRNAIIDIKNGNTDSFTDYDYSHEMSGTITQMSYHDDPTLTGQFKKMATTTNDFFELILEGKELEDLKKMRIKNGEAPDPRLDKIDVLTYNLYSFGNGAIGISNFGVLTEEEKSVLARFSNVFTFAYKRYKDMLQAEQQAREALVELSLERIRAQVTAMRESSELLDIVVTMQTEFNKLGHEAHYFWHMRWLPDKYEKALTNGEGDRIGNVLELPRGFHGLKNMMDWEESDEPSAVFALDPNTAADYIDKMIKLGRFQEIDHTAPGPDEVREMGGLTFVMARTTHGEIGYTLPGEVPNPPKDDVALLVRFAGVFDLAYRRFEDLKSAERQNRETQIDLALERVRAKTMAMQKSEELSEVVANLFYQLDELGIKPYRCNLGIINAKTKYCQLWSTTSDGKVIPLAPNIPLTENKHLKKIYHGWKKQSAPFVDIIQGKNRLEWTQYIRKFSDFEEYKPEKLNKKKILSEPAILNQVFFKQGFFTIHTVEEMKDEYFDILQRFARVFEQTYTRFLDLQRAEVQASEAVKQASLDRIRGQIASMRTTEDLKQLTPLVWRELKTLEVPFFRCGLFIVDEKKKHVNVYLTTPDGKPLGVLDLDFKANDLARDTVASWKKKEVYQTHWNREEFIAWTKEMMQLGQVKVPEKYQGAEEPPESLHLHFIPFAQGMLYVGHEEQLEKEKIDLVKSLAEAFSFAYARYEDFVVLEEAKERVEKALSDLKATQSQLVHAEKMASLGELTAGIAHEIQNPLNFVNNFSEVSTDLIEELKEELQNGDTEEVKAIATDLLQNLEKINHHGKRASNIVKSMLEHSRAGSAEKQPTDLNALADEYLRLAYHGLRAKDKSFNADFKIEADKSLPKVNIVAQDIGRVLLNLINNGFYAVSEKSKQSGEDYKPELIVTTKNTGGKVEISVKDNGKGIPDKVKEKIFQPFFTTKPTGQGTGLGLSMSYDIIKAHGGEIKVDTNENDGTVFTIMLPKA